MRHDLRGSSPSLSFAPGVTIQSDQINMGKQIIGGKLQGFLDATIPSSYLPVSRQAITS